MIICADDLGYIKTRGNIKYEDCNLVFSRIIEFINTYESQDEFKKNGNKIENKIMTQDNKTFIGNIGDFKLIFETAKYGNHNENWSVNIYYHNVWTASVILIFFQWIIAGHKFNISHKKMDDVIDELTANIINISENINIIDTFNYFRANFYVKCINKSKYTEWNN